VVGNLAFGEQDVQRRHGRADLEDPVVDNREVRQVRATQRHPVTRPDATGDQHVAADPIPVGQLMLLSLQIALRGNRATHLDDLHQVAHDRQRRLPRPRIVAHGVEHALPQGQLPDPERLQEVGQLGHGHRGHAPRYPS
jgi:hypothetical protein